MDFAYNQQGTRHFQVRVNGVLQTAKFGTHGGTGFAWANGGTITLTAGENTLELVDTSGFGARCDAVLLTANAEYIPAEDFNSISSLVAPFTPVVYKDKGFPQYAKVQNEPVTVTEIQNANTKVVFYTVPTSKGNVIQNEIYSMYNGEWVKTKNRTEELGYVVISADSAQERTPYQDMYTFSTQYQAVHSKDGMRAMIYTRAVYLLGISRTVYKNYPTPKFN